MRASILTGALLFSYISVAAQDSLGISGMNPAIDSILLVKNDTSQVQAVHIDSNFTELKTATIEATNDNMKKSKYRSPVKAGLYSAIIPGLGQAYNRQYWKIPLIYIGGGVLIGFCDYFNNHYKEYRDLYNKEKLKNSSFQDPENYGDYRDWYRKKRDRFILYTGVVYAANIVDAMVYAYFSEFDISNNLSLKVSPVIDYPQYASMGGSLSYGMSFKLKF